MQQTNWYVITGAPSSGKTSVINELKKMGYHTEPEVARSLISEILTHHNRKYMEKNIYNLQMDILEIKLQREKKADKERLTFFDRGLPDSIAYFKVRDLPAQAAMNACTFNKYKGVFLFERLEFTDDGLRSENKELAGKIEKQIIYAYERLNYEIIHVPVMSIEKRTQFVLSHIEENLL